MGPVHGWRRNNLRGQGLVLLQPLISSVITVGAGVRDALMRPQLHEETLDIDMVTQALLAPPLP